jgi:hypothetical protein
VFDDPEDYDNGSPFEPYDIKMLIGYALIAWAVVVGVFVAMAYLVNSILHHT